MTAEFSGLGDLTTAEVARIQSTVERLQAETNQRLGIPQGDNWIELSVVGSAARGQRRGAGTDLPVGHGPGTRSDIDYQAPPELRPLFESAHPNSPFGSVDELPHMRLPDYDRYSGVFLSPVEPGTPHIVFRPGQEPEARGPVPDGPRPRPPRPGDEAPRTQVDGVDGARPDAVPEPRPTAPEGGARTTAGDAGGASDAGGCTTCGSHGGSRPGGAGTEGDAGVQAAPAAPPPGARAAPGAPPPPADGAEAFARAQRVGGSTQDGVVYAVGGSADDHQIYRYTPDGQYLGPADRVPRGATELGVTSQIQDLQSPGAPMQRFLTAPDGQRYAIGPEGMAEVRPDGTLRTLSPAERASLPRSVQSQAMVRAAGPALAMPDGINGSMWRNLGQEMVGNWADGAEIHRDVSRAAQGATPGAPRVPSR